jgi:hypothetical protein
MLLAKDESASVWVERLTERNVHVALGVKPQKP